MLGYSHFVVALQSAETFPARRGKHWTRGHPTPRAREARKVRGPIVSSPTSPQRIVWCEHTSSQPALGFIYRNMSSAMRDAIPPSSHNNFFIDISQVVQTDHKTGIQRVVRAVVNELLCAPPSGFDIKLVYTTVSDPTYRYTYENFAAHLPQYAKGRPQKGSPIHYGPGDIFLGLDLAHLEVIDKDSYFQAMRHAGVQVFFVVYDLLPLNMPQAFPDGVDNIHQMWTAVIAKCDGLLGCSAAVAGEIEQWLDQHVPKNQHRPKVTWFHLGADLERSLPSRGYPEGAAAVLDSFKQRHTFLSVSTIEPRKGHYQTIRAFEILWSQGIDANLVFVGKAGWKVDELISKLTNHPERGKRFFWLQNISDEYLHDVYDAADCLIFASEGEGFGLPLVEAAHHRLPVITRDIPVFREIGEEHFFYFKGTSGAALAERVKVWLDRLKTGQELPKSESIKWQTWKGCAEQIVSRILPACT